LYFYISKIVWPLMQPSTVVALLLLAGLGLIGTRRKRLAIRLLAAATAILVVAGVLPFSYMLALPLEERFARADLSDGRPVDGIIILGGGEETRIPVARKVQSINEAGERLTEALALGLRFPKARIVFTGGTISFKGDKDPETGAVSAELFFRELGLPKERLILEPKARNTRENALFTKELVKPKPGERWLLVTSAWHMPRSIGCFRVIGFDVEPWPVDYRTGGAGDFWQIETRPSDGLLRTDIMLREWVGLLAYRLQGYTDALFPRPYR
jgi:uncharacterized SAM-binding protein YcdF (DUF218 family)